MAFKSKSELRRWKQLLLGKKITQEQFDRKFEGTDVHVIPEYAGKRPAVARVHRHKK